MSARLFAILIATALLVVSARGVAAAPGQPPGAPERRLGAVFRRPFRAIRKRVGRIRTAWDRYARRNAGQMYAAGAITVLTGLGMVIYGTRDPAFLKAGIAVTAAGVTTSALAVPRLPRLGAGHRSVYGQPAGPVARNGTPTP